MKQKAILLILFSSLLFGNITFSKSIQVEFLGDSIRFSTGPQFYVPFDSQLNSQSIQAFYSSINESDYQSLIDSMLVYKNNHDLNDWLYYQLIRKVAQQVSPKAENYYRYTLYKWFLLTKSGYDATLLISESQLLFYVHSEDNIYGIPFFKRDMKQYVCLNYHDYGKIDFTKETLVETDVRVPEGIHSFSYKVTQMPDFLPCDYQEKELQFSYNDEVYHFKIKLNSEINTLFNHYPVVDFESYFNTPLSKEAYNSLIPELKNYMTGMNQKRGVDYLMRFTRYSFLYETDQQNFGEEKRLTPEQTLLYKYSDCDDRAALFFYLVKEIYDLPMIVLLYPTHVTIAVQFDKCIGKPILFKGKEYSVCEPTPQKQDLSVGQLSHDLKKKPYEVVYEYNPIKK